MNTHFQCIFSGIKGVNAYTTQLVWVYFWLLGRSVAELADFRCHLPFSNHTVSICVSTVQLQSASGFINNRNVIFFCPHHPLCCSLSLFPLLCLQPFMSPRYPGGPRPSLRMPNQVINIWLNLTHVRKLKNNLSGV